MFDVTGDGRSVPRFLWSVVAILLVAVLCVWIVGLVAGRTLYLGGAPFGFSLTPGSLVTEQMIDFSVGAGVSSSPDYTIPGSQPGLLFVNVYASARAKGPLYVEVTVDNVTCTKNRDQPSDSGPRYVAASCAKFLANGNDHVVRVKTGLDSADAGDPSTPNQAGGQIYFLSAGRR